MMRIRKTEDQVTKIWNELGIDRGAPSTRGAQCGKKRVTQQLLCSKSHDFLAVCPLAHSEIKKIA